jgi:hypothetical protein
VTRRGVEDIEPGFVLEHRGSRLGVVECVEHGRGPWLLHVRGGRSGSLEYLVAGSDVVAVRPERGVGEVRPDVDFHQATLEPDGHVTLVARERPATARGPSGGISSACAGFDCFAVDGRVGRVEAVLPGPRTPAAFLVVSVRRRGRRRYPVLPAARVIAVDPAERVVLVRGDRDGLRSAPERVPTGGRVRGAPAVPATGRPPGRRTGDVR